MKGCGKQGQACNVFYRYNGVSVIYPSFAIAADITSYLRRKSSCFLLPFYRHSKYPLTLLSRPIFPKAPCGRLIHIFHCLQGSRLDDDVDLPKEKRPRTARRYSDE